MLIGTPLNLDIDKVRLVRTVNIDNILTRYINPQKKQLNIDDIIDI